MAEEAFTSLPDTVWKSLTESGLSMATETLLSITGWAYNIQASNFSSPSSLHSSKESN